MIMKIVTLIPVKNEGWILRFSLKNFSLFSDEIIILDDSSSDNLCEIVKEFPKVKTIPFISKEKFVDMSLRRNILLEEGRKIKGTHFVFLDADEIFSENLAKYFNEVVFEMKKGEKLLLPWVTAIQKDDFLFFNSKDKKNYKDFIFCDDGVSKFKQQSLSEARTPGDELVKKYISFEKGFAIHFQCLIKKKYDLKQAWYRANELFEAKRSARRINATYNFTKFEFKTDGNKLDDKFVKDNFILIEQNISVDFYINQFKHFFKEKGILFFEPLDIWHISELKDIFVAEYGRDPRKKVFPGWLLCLNNVKNIVKNKILS